jgi:hypothetical protein
MNELTFMPLRYALLLPLFFLTACAEFSEVHSLAKETSNLVGTPGKVLGRRLRIEIDGGSKAQGAGLIAAFKSELEDGNLFQEVDSSEKLKGLSSGLLKVKVEKYLSTEFGSWYTDIEGYIVRYDLRATLVDRAGIKVLDGALAGIAYDDDSKVFKAEKIGDLDVAAQRDAAVKLSDVLREDVERKVEAELKRIRPIKLARGVGPLKIGIIHINRERAHPNIRASEIETDLFTALDLAGNELSVVNPQFIDQILDQNNVSKFEGLSLTEKTMQELRRVLPVKLVVIIRVRSRIQGVEMDASISELGREGRSLGQITVRARGVGALRVATIRLSRRLIWRIAKTKFVLEEDKE